ncbi:glycosyltransferase family 4 protein [Pengzhenrongella frigida]|uniref:Glycosyltransferase n=1 Tax=Pengzhenrongella frigida TaxID=1259133 RepID=A0A4V1ZH44_9MICO|nr:glycosyltransferase family 4 protein [Cellulomonas sp. HLT2-17]RYV50754.1 glycosyltransferase [Cellulomonas sp. HLT2-17]
MHHGLVHVITPGDHFSPRTGSAIPTVVDGLSRATPAGARRPAVLVARGTYPDRYDSADVIEYDRARTHRFDRYVDAGLPRLRLPRVMARHEFAAAVTQQDDWDPAVVLAHNAVQAIPLVDARRHTPVLYAHNLLLRTYGRREIARTLGPAAAIVCVSQALADQTSRYLTPSLRGRVRVVLNGVDAAAFARPAAARRGDLLRVVYVGRMIPDKGADVLIEAVRLLGRSDLHLTLVGGRGFAANDALSPYELDVRRRLAQLGDHATAVSFVPRAEVVRLLQQADVVVVPSVWQEPFALTVLEGMAAGAAVVGSDIGGIPEALGDAGVRVPPGDAAALADVLAAFADDQGLLERTQARCRAHAEANDWRAARSRLGAVLGAIV